MLSNSFSRFLSNTRKLSSLEQKEFRHFPKNKMLISKLTKPYGLFGWRGEGEGVEESRVVLAKNKLILC